MSNPDFLLEPDSIPIPRGLAVLLRDSMGIRSSDGAMFIQQLHYWLTKEEGFLHTDKKTNQTFRWIWNSYDKWREQFPWWTDWDFRIIVKALREHSLIIFDQLLDFGRNRIGCYRLNYEHEWLKPLIHHHSLDMTTDATGEQLPVATDDCTTDITETTTYTTSETTTHDVVEEESNVEEEIDEPTDEEVGIACTQIRALSPEIVINQTVRSAVRIGWANVPAALAYITEAIRTWKVKPDFNWTGLVVKALKNSALLVERNAQPPPKQYPRPSLEQLDSLGRLGSPIYTALNEPGYPEVLAVQIGDKAIAWWDALKLGGEP